MFPWRAVILINKASGKPIYLQVVDSIIAEIHAGRLRPGQKLPGARTLGELLGLNRKTIVAAMDELNSQGWIESFVHKGTFVSSRIPSIAYQSLPGKELPGNQETTAVQVNDPSWLETLYLDGSGKKMMDDGVPDVRLAPMQQLFAHHRSLLSKKAYLSLLKYNHVAGDLDLRTTLSTYLQETRGINSTPENIFLTRGSQMGIYLTLAALIKRGDSCFTTFPGYQIVDDMIKHLGGKVVHIPVDEEGLLTGSIEKICKKKKIKLLYATPHHHYPTTVTLSPDRRIELLRLASKYNFFILEDDYAYDFQYANNPVLPLASVNNNRVIYIGSFSKCISPSVRTGYVVASGAVIKVVNKLRRIIDRQGDPLLERALSEFIKSGDLQRHLKKVVKLSLHRRDYFCALLTKHLSGEISFVKPEGGMSVWIVFKKAKTAKGLLEKLCQAGYLIDSERVFLEKLHAIRIGFASLTEKEMEDFVGALRDAAQGSP
ncbi:aminotransferase-like domain-containing protein [Paraflavitalea soli]|nr:PLP-dependent aminotransferase family protein [Paraflavitalea soli]